MANLTLCNRDFDDLHKSSVQVIKQTELPLSTVFNVPYCFAQSFALRRYLCNFLIVRARSVCWVDFVPFPKVRL